MKSTEILLKIRGIIMRRKDREVTEISGIEEILLQCKTCHVAMVDDGMPYVVPLSHGFRIVDGNILELYFHSAKEGRKIDVLRRNDTVCFEMANEGEPVHSETPCYSGYYYSSLIGFGKAVFIEDDQEKCEALSIMSKHQSGREATFTVEQVQGVCVFKIVSTSFVGKKKPISNK
jgi:nitroimidazol reductase NimA-like FMN-containing flavoprotein (pyridoxamine 5'-phosphate oxidase superfamily)